MELGHWLACSNFACEFSLMVSPGFFCLLVCSSLEFSVTYYGAFCLYVATNFFFILVFCPKLQLYLVLLQSLCMFYNLSMCILLFFSYILSLLLLFFMCHLLELLDFHYHITAGMAITVNFKKITLCLLFTTYQNQQTY